jgi:hypothetical protein
VIEPPRFSTCEVHDPLRAVGETVEHAKVRQPFPTDGGAVNCVLSKPQRVIFLALPQLEWVMGWAE